MGINILHKPAINFKQMSWRDRCIVFCGVGFGSGLAPKAPEIQYHLSVALVKAGDKPGARKQLEQLLAANKEFPQRAEAQALLTQL